MAPLTSEEIEERLDGLEVEVAQMRQDERLHWARVIAFLRSFRRASLQQGAGAEQAADELERLRGEGS